MRRIRFTGLLLTVVCLKAFSDGEPIMLFPPASNQLQQGFVRIINGTSAFGEVEIEGVDDNGFVYGPVSFKIAPYAAQQVNSNDLEMGNESKGLEGAFGQGSGNWQLFFTSNVSLTTLGFIRTPEGFMTSIHSYADAFVGKIHDVDVFNPAQNLNQVSKLRIVNLRGANSAVEISGTDDSGNTPSETAEFVMAAWSSIELTATDIEEGNPSKGISGGIGDGQGKWRLRVITSQRSKVMSLLEAPGGYLSNLSPSQQPGRDKEFPDLGCTDIDGASIFSQEDEPVYLGFFGSDFASDSVNNTFGSYGSSFGSGSIRNEFGRYGSSTGSYSHASSFASNPPVVVKEGRTLFYLTIRSSYSSASYSLATIDSSCSFYKSSRADFFSSPY